MEVWGKTQLIIFDGVIDQINSKVEAIKKGRTRTKGPMSVIWHFCITVASRETVLMVAKWELENNLRFFLGPE